MKAALNVMPDALENLGAMPMQADEVRPSGAGSASGFLTQPQETQE